MMFLSTCFERTRLCDANHVYVWYFGKFGKFGTREDTAFHCQWSALSGQILLSRGCSQPLRLQGCD